MNDSIEELLKTANLLEGKIDNLLKLHQSAIDSLPEEEKKKLSFVDRDIQEMKKALADRDMNKIQTYLEKYASNSTKY